MRCGCRLWPWRNYLRVRGEYHFNKPGPPSIKELPPRARRILRCHFSELGHSGTTSACAENTKLLKHDGSFLWNYLRVRGEYAKTGTEGFGGVELPPRARRIPHRSEYSILKGGTTSACAENTPCFRMMI